MCFDNLKLSEVKALKIEYAGLFFYFHIISLFLSCILHLHIFLNSICLTGEKLKKGAFCIVSASTGPQVKKLGNTDVNSRIRNENYNF